MIASHFVGKGKVQLFKILEKYVQTQEVFGNLTNMEELDETSEEIILFQSLCN